MADNKFEVIIGANSAELNRELSKATKSLSNFQSKVDKIASQGKKLATIGAGLSAVVTAPLVALSGAALNAFTEIEGVRLAFNRLNDANLLSDLQKATNNTTADIDLMKAAVNAKNFGLPIQELGTLLEFANRRAKDTGQSVDYLVESIVNGIGRKSPLILDNLGISAIALRDALGEVSLEAASVSQITEAVGKIASSELKKMGKDVLTLGERFAQLKTVMQNALVQIGDILAPVISPIVDKALELAKGFQNLSDATKRWIVILGGVAAAIGPLLLGLGGLMSALPIIVSGVGALGAAFTFLLSPIGLVTAALVGVVVAVVANWDKIRPYIIKAQNWFIDLYNESVILRVGINYIANNFKSVFAIVSRVLGLVWNQFKNFGKLVIDLFGNIGDVISGALTLDPKKIVEGVKGFGESFKASFDRTSTNIIGQVKGLANDIGDIWSKDLTGGKLERKALLSIKLPDLAKDVEDEVFTEAIEGVKNGIKNAQEEIEKSPEAFALQIPVQLFFDGDQLYKNTRRLFEANGELSERMQATFEQMSLPIKKGLSEAQVALIEFENVINERFQSIARDSIIGGLQGVFSSIGTAIGEGGNILQAAGGALISAFSGFLSEMGGMLVKYGTLAVLKGKLDLAIKAGGLTAIGAGFAAIAVGALLSVAGAALGARASQGLSGGGGGGYTGYSSYTSPAANANSVSGTNQNNEVTFTIRGNDLVGAINNNQERTSRITGL